MLKTILSSAALLAFVASSASATQLSFPFDTNASTSFTVVEFNGPDSSIDWTYDYSTHVQDAPAIAVAIPSAPNSAGTTTGVRLAVNLTLAVANSLTLYPDISSIAAEFADGDWQMTFDVWANHNGDALGNTGSTEFFGFGAQDDAANPGIGSDGDNGFNYYITADGGSSNDYRYAAGAPLAANNLGANYFGNAVVNNTALEAAAFFPNDGTGSTPPAGAVTSGVPGKQWVTVRLTVSNAGADRVVEFKKASDADFTIVSSITGGLGAFAQPLIAYADFFSSVASEPTDQFVVFDNLVLEGTPTSSVSNWMLMN